MTFGEVVRAYRDKNGFRIGVRGMAGRLGIGSATLSRVENGADPDIRTFFKICVGLGLNPADYVEEFSK